MTTNRFRHLYDANLYEMYWLEEYDLKDKLASVRKRAERRIKELQANNRSLDTQYYYSLSLNEPIKYEHLQNYLNGKKGYGVQNRNSERRTSFPNNVR